ncbi:MAG: hypothetical protein HC892_00145 [Saprospiraceae bacterium]|nr:hypothetical protein [Saprospiraceae bacterium]
MVMITGIDQNQIKSWIEQAPEGATVSLANAHEVLTPILQQAQLAQDLTRILNNQEEEL